MTSSIAHRRLLGGLAICIAVLGTTVACGGSPAEPLSGVDRRTGHCVSGAPSRSWSERLSQVTEFGLDAVKLPSTSTKAVVTSVVLDGLKGRLTVRKAAFVPGEAIGDGFQWGNAEGIISPAEWAARTSMPNAVLRYIDPATHPQYARGFDGLTWELVLGLQPGPSGGQAADVQLHYTIDGHDFTYVGNASVGMYPDRARCDKFLG